MGVFLIFVAISTVCVFFYVVTYEEPFSAVWLGATVLSIILSFGVALKTIFELSSPTYTACQQRCLADFQQEMRNKE